MHMPVIKVTHGITPDYRCHVLYKSKVSGAVPGPPPAMSITREATTIIEIPCIQYDRPAVSAPAKFIENACLIV